MKDQPRQVLCDLMTKYGQDLSNDGQRCEALLRDFCGKARSEISILIAALREGIVTELRSSKQTVPTGVLLARLDQKLQDHLYLQPEAAMWAVDTWAIALGVIQQPRSPISPAPDPDPDDNKSESQPSSSYTVQQMWGMSGVLLTGIIALAGLSYFQYEETQRQYGKVQAIEAEIQAESDRYSQQGFPFFGGAEILLKNSCSEPITIALRYKYASSFFMSKKEDDTWQTEGWWQLKPGQSFYMEDANKRRITSYSQIIYFYARTTSGKTVRWEGAREFAVGDRKYPMRFRVLELDSSKALRMELSC